jgi:hypothetical protein
VKISVLLLAWLQIVEHENEVEMQNKKSVQ